MIPKDMNPGVRPKIEQLRSADAVTRAKAAYELGEMGDDAIDAIPFLADTIEDRTRLRWSPTAPAAHLAFTSPGTEAVTALVKLSAHPVAIKALLEGLHSDRSDVRQNIITYAPWIPDPHAADLVTRGLADLNFRVRCQAALTLQRIMGRIPLPRLSTGLPPPTIGAERRSAHANAFRPLVKCLEDTSVAVREQAVYALGALGDRRAVEPLSVLLQDKSQKVQCAAAAALGTLGATDSFKTLLAELDKDGWVTATDISRGSRVTSRYPANAGARMGLATMGIPVLPLLLEDLEGADSKKKARRLDVIRDILRTDRSAIDTIINCAQDPEGFRSDKTSADRLRCGAVFALSRIYDDGVIPGLVTLLQDSDPTFRCTVVGLLGKRNDERARAATIGALHDTDWRVRIAAAKALVATGDASAANHLQPLLSDPVAAVREVAKTALALK